MTTETSISSISGGNLNPVSQSSASTNNNVNKKLVNSDKIENLQVSENCVDPRSSVLEKLGARIVNWIFCGPCIVFLKTSSAFRKMILTSITIIVTTLLVASPILFLISAAPSNPHHHRDDCMLQRDCMINSIAISECTEDVCIKAAKTVTTTINWTKDACNDFKSFCCSSHLETFRAFKSSQEIVDHNILQLLTQNATTGPFRQLGRLFDSCLRIELNSSTTRFLVEHLGGFLPPHLIPYSVTPLMTKILKHFRAPLPLFDLYYDLSYGRRPQILMIIDIPMDVNKIFHNPIRWKAPKAPTFKINEYIPKLFEKVINFLIPNNLSEKQRELERFAVESFIKKLNHIRKEYSRIDRDFLNSYVIDNVSALIESYPFLNWTELIPSWSGAIVLRSPKYLEKLQDLLTTQHNRIIHNSLLTLFILNILPDGESNTPLVCAKATMSILPEACSSLYLSQFDDDKIQDAIARANAIFDLLKSNLKRAPNLRGAALVRLSSLKMQAEPWPVFQNQTAVLSRINELEISSDNWIQNVLKIYKQQTNDLDESQNFTLNNIDTTWAFPIISRAFYNSLSHKIVIPLSLILAPFFDANLPPYLHFSTVGTTISKEILRSITKTFEEKAMKCVPSSVNIFSNHSRMELLIASGGFQIAYHSMLSLSGSKSMQSLPGLNLTSIQMFFLVTAQEFCSKSQYEGIETESIDFHDILSWLFAQGGIASQHFNCKYGSAFRVTQNCGIW